MANATAGIINYLATLKKSDLPAPLQKEIQAVIHKVRYPMARIIDKVPGNSVTERAKKLRVSRQTVYVWINEKFRPTRVQARRISKITGVPIEHIIDDGFEVIDENRRKARKKAARLAAERAQNPASDERVQPDAAREEAV